MGRRQRVGLALLVAAAAVAAWFAFRPGVRFASGDVLWKGTVRSASGRPVRGPGALELFPEGMGGTPRILPFDGEGRFSDRVPVGSYDLLARFPGVGREPIAVPDPARFEGGDVERDVTVPVGTVRGVVRDAETQEPLRGHADQTVTLTHRGDILLTSQTVHLEDDGSFRFDGLRFGRYSLGGWPRSLALAGDDATLVELTESSPDVLLAVDSLLPRGAPSR